MSFFQQNFLTTLTSNFDEQQWVELIRKTLDDELEEESEIPVTIFGVPKTLMICDPDSYIPQLVAIGPYHHFRAELYNMERYKVGAAKRNQKELQNINFQDIVDHLIKYEVRIRANYHQPLSYNCETLAWMMALDASFLFEFLQVCGVKEGKVLTKVPSRVTHLNDLSKNKPAHNAILRDIILLENQIPLFVIRMLLQVQFSSLDLANEALFSFLIGISKELSPFKMAEDSDNKRNLKDCNHLLDFLYHFIVPKVEVPLDQIIEIHEDGKEGAEAEENPLPNPGYMRHLIHALWQIISKLGAAPKSRS